MENHGSGRTKIYKRRHKGLLKKANELAKLCSADVGIITIFDDGIIHEYASNHTSVQDIVIRYKEFLKIRDESATESSSKEHLHDDEEEMVDVMPENENPNEDMKLEEIVRIEDEASKGLMYIWDRKMQMIMEERRQQEWLKKEKSRAASAHGEDDWLALTLGPSVHRQDDNDATAQ